MKKLTLMCYCTSLQAGRQETQNILDIKILILNMSNKAVQRVILYVTHGYNWSCGRSARPPGPDIVLTKPQPKLQNKLS